MMNTQTLNGVAAETLDNYRAAAKHATVAYRLGSHRLVSALNGALANEVYPRTAGIAPRTTVRIDEVRARISEVIVKGIDDVADRTLRAIDSSSTVAVAQLNRAYELAAGVDNPIVANGLQTAARLTLPGANVARVLSSKVAQGAQALADAAGARVLRKTARKAAAGVKRKTKAVAGKATTRR